MVPVADPIHTAADEENAAALADKADEQNANAVLENSVTSPPELISAPNVQSSSEPSRSDMFYTTSTHIHPFAVVPVHHVDSGLRFRELTPSEVAAADLPPMYTPD